MGESMGVRVKPRKAIKIELTLAQCAILEPLIEELYHLNTSGSGGAIMAQVYPDAGHMDVNLMDAATCARLQPILLENGYLSAEVKRKIEEEMGVQTKQKKTKKNNDKGG